MKPLILALALLAGTFASAQTSPYQALKNKFSSREDVFAFSARGFVARTALKLAGEREFRKAIRKVKSVRIISIPKAAFQAENVTVGGFRKVVASNAFEEVVSVRDHGDDVTIYMKEARRSRDNRYFILVNDDTEVVAIEVKGFIDTAVLRQNDPALTGNTTVQ